MASTLVGPIRIPQINRNYYVGEPMQRNIQQAVTFAIADSNAGNVIVPQDYTGSDTVAAVTGGSPTVYIIDERHGQRQAYLWYNNAYIYEPTHASGGVLTPQINNYAYVGFGTNPTIQGVIDNFAVLPTLTITIIIEPSYTGGEVISNLTNGDPGIVISDQRTAQWQNYNWNGIQFVPTDFEPLGQIIADSITADTITTNDINAGDANLATCIVDDSPVRTFANTSDTGPGDGMLWPDIGIAVSAGDHWQSPSIDPTTIATIPPAGIPVSTGTAWGTSIPAANIPLLNAPSNAFSGPIYTSQLGITNPNTGSGASLIAVQPNITPGNVTSLFVGQSNLPFNAVSFGFDFEGADSTGNRGIIGFAGESRKVAFDSAANWTFDGIVTTPQLTINSSITGDNSPVFAIQPNVTAGSVISLVVGQSNSLANAVYYGFNFAGAGSGSNHGIIGFVGGNRQVTFDQDANWTFDGIVTAAVKNFRIRFPGSAAGDNRWLIHSSLEGPEIAVFYRGEDVTSSGSVEITLPEYFESLTRPEGRTVTLTQLFEEDDEDFSLLAASRVIDGTFRVQSSIPTQKFYWEVKAVRADVEPLQVITEKEAVDKPVRTTPQPNRTKSRR